MTDDEDPPTNITRFPVTGERKKGGGRRKPAAEIEKKPWAPALPPDKIDFNVLRQNATNPTRRAWAAFAMRKRMVPWLDIAEFLDFENIGQVKAAVYGVMENTADREETEVLRQTLIAGLEDQLQRSISLASAEYLVDEEGNKHPNEARLAWHKEARQDYEALARISGAQAAAQIQLISPESDELDRIVREIEIIRGHGVIEADVVDVEVIDDATG